MTDRRLTQEVVEAPARLAPTDNPRRLTQLLIEASARLAAANNPRRLTQLVIEVAYVNPSQPFGEALMPDMFEWSPAYASYGEEGQAITYASYFGPHSDVIVLGERGTRIRLRRR